VTRTILAAAALIAAASLLPSGAQACISCEYVPEVVRSSSTLPHTGHYYVPPSHSSNKDYSAPAKRRVVKSEPVARKLNVAKGDKADKADKVERAEAKVEKKAEKKIAKVEPTETTKVADSENSSISLASNDVAAVKDTVAKPAKEVSAKPTDCKKFFASVGMTLTVPCE
jgi:hypothetical protein